MPFSLSVAVQKEKHAIFSYTILSLCLFINEMDHRGNKASNEVSTTSFTSDSHKKALRFRCLKKKEEFFFCNPKVIMFKDQIRK